jgi:hypothetical protein
MKGQAMSRRPMGRQPAVPAAEVDAYRAQHLALAERQIVSAGRRRSVTVDESESPLAWLARRKGRDGRPMIEPAQLLAGERLRAEFTRAHLTPRVTSRWEEPVNRTRGAAAASGGVTDAALGARQSVHRALDAVGTEFAGLLLDVCCFLKGLEDVERERGWPSRSAKVVLQLGLDRLARHYGYGGEARGAAHACVRTWLAPDAALAADGD